jgi:CheY-like chemotaxis protein
VCRAGGIVLALKLNICEKKAAMHERPAILLVDDDTDDEQLLRDALRRLGDPYPLAYFSRAEDALVYLRDARSPFLIICDVNMPGMDGIRFKQILDADPLLRGKSIPFVFFSTTAQPATVSTAYQQLTVQGFFQKPNDFAELQRLLQVMIVYWMACRRPDC